MNLDSDDDIDELKEIIKKKKLTWRSFQNDEGVDGTISEMWGISGWPTIFLIDARIARRVAPDAAMTSLFRKGHGNVIARSGPTGRDAAIHSLDPPDGMRSILSLSPVAAARHSFHVPTS